jgi:glycosidase
MKKVLLLVVIALQVATFGYSHNVDVYPSSWWVGMRWNKVQLLLEANSNNGFDKQQISINYPGVKITKLHQLDNSKYIAVDIVIAPNTKPGNVQIVFNNNGTKTSVLWPLQARRKGMGTQFAKGVTSSDFIYFLMPDRFSNGDASNDKIVGMRDQSLNRDSMYLRHGGDLQGVINHLDYLQSLGVTTLWMTPVLENDMPNRTEHGYAFTNHYKIDPRYGGSEMYKKLSDALHQRGMKLIQDAVYNHVGSFHHTFTQQPTKDWYHQWPSFTGTSYKDQPLFDPHASKKDAKITTDGWFTRQMPDLNQNNPYVANFLIQHALWCVEEFGVDGWRIDTYPYNDMDFMNRCNKALTDEYPKMTLFGEAWVHGVINQSYFVQNNLNIKTKSNLQGVLDFQTLFYGIQPALNENFGWTEGVTKLYTTLSQDLLYKDATRNVIFLDNHDMTRFFTTVRGDVAKQKMGLMWLLTCRGIPQLYYGTEVLMAGEGSPDGLVRSDFLGGWRSDKKSAFTGEGLSKDEIEVQDLVKKLGKFRLQSSALKTGKLMQYLPEDGLYVYFRYYANQTVMCVMNTSDKEKMIDFKNYTERTIGFNRAINVVTNNNLGSQFTIATKRMLVLQLAK